MADNIQSYVNLLKRLSPQAQRLTLDSRNLAEGDVFIAVPGFHKDGRDFLEQAAQKACAVVYEDDGVRRTFGVPAIAVPELKRHLVETVEAVNQNPDGAYHNAFTFQTMSVEIDVQEKTKSSLLSRIFNF